MRLAILLMCSVVAVGQNTTQAPEGKPEPPQSSDRQNNKYFGNYLSIWPPTRQVGALDILSDTHGVDFGPYLQNLMKVVRQNWYILIPEAAAKKKGWLAIEFKIKDDGHVGDMRLVTRSADISQDKAAWGSITNSNPFPPLPKGFKGPLALRFRFYYNAEKDDLAKPNSPASH